MKTKRQQPKISPQLFSKMVENTVGAKVHLNYAVNKEGNLKRAHFYHARGYLGELAQIVERLRSDIGLAISRMPIRTETASGSRPSKK